MSSKILLLNSKQVKAITKSHPALQGKKLIASGMFSGVYEGSRPDTVLKLTICSATRQLLTDPTMQSSAHTPQLICDYGKVGDFTTGTNIIETKITKPIKRLVPVYLIEVERLQKMPKGSNRSLSLHIAKAIKYAQLAAVEGQNNKTSQTEGILNLIKSSKTVIEHPTVCAYLKNLTDFMNTAKGAFYDVHPANMMQREDGTFVFSDPIGSCDIFETQGLFAGVQQTLSDVQWTAIKRDHQARFAHLKQPA